MQGRAFSRIRERRYPDVPGLANEVCAKTLGLGRSLRITVEILFGSLAADNKVPRSRDPPFSPPEIVPYPPTHTHINAHTHTCVTVCSIREARAWAGIMGGAYSTMFTPARDRVPRTSPWHLLSPTYLAIPSN